MAVSPAIGDTASNPVITRQVQPQATTNQVYQQILWLDINPDGYMWSSVSLEGTDLSIGATTIDSMVPSDIYSIFRYADVSTRPANSPDDMNADIWLSFESNDAAESRTAADQIKARVEAVMSIGFTFQQIWSEDQWDGGSQVWRTYTHVEYVGHIDWVNFDGLIASSIPTSYGGIAASIDVSVYQQIGFGFWFTGDGIWGAIRLGKGERVPGPTGGFSFSLNDIFVVSGFAAPSSVQYTNIGIRVPDATNLHFSVTNSSVTTVYTNYHDAGQYNQEPGWDITIEMQQGASFSDITFGFDYEFISWSWRNRDEMWWYVDPRAYTNINLDVYGRYRAAPSANLLVDSALLYNVSAINFYVEPSDNQIPGWDQAWINIYYPWDFDFTLANDSAKLIVAELETLGLNFTGYDNSSNDIIWDQGLQQDINVMRLSWYGSLDTAAWSNLLTNSYASQQSAMIQATDKLVITTYNWNVWADDWGLASSVDYMHNELLPTNGNPYASYAQGIDSSFYADLQYPDTLGWSGFPWGPNSELLSLNFESFTTAPESVAPAEPTNNGFGWDSGLSQWFDDQNGLNHFSYHMNIYSSDPMVMDNFGNNVSMLTQTGIGWNNRYFGPNADLASPWSSPWMKDQYATSGTYFDNYLYKYLGSYNTITGTIDIASKAVESTGDSYWNGTDWVNRYPMSGVADCGLYAYFNDAPIDDSVFTVDIPLVHDTTWDPQNPVQPWVGQLDTTTMPDGQWSFVSTAVDNAGNYYERNPIVLDIDNYLSTTPATIAWDSTSPAPDSGLGNIVDLKFSVTDDIGAYAVIVWVNLAGYYVQPTSTYPSGFNTVTTYDFSLDVLALGLPEDAPIQIKIQVLDLDGFWSYYTANFFVDNIPSGNPPTFSSVTPDDNTVFNNTESSVLSFSLIVADDIGIQEVDLLIGSTSFSMFYSADKDRYVVDLNLALWQLGDYQWHIKIIDVDENQHTVETDTRTLTIIGLAPTTEDTTPPDLHLVSPEDGSQVTGDVEIVVMATDDVGIAQVSITLPSQTVKEMTAGANNTYSYVWSSSDGLDGMQALSVTARDAAGNPTTISFSLDASNGRSGSSPDVGISLPGFELPVVMIAVLSFYIIRKRKVIRSS